MSSWVPFSALLASFWSISIDTGTFLLPGLLLASVFQLFISQQFVTKHLRSRGLSSILKASAIGIPLPLCSCGVLPVAAALRKNGAGPGATASFLVSTPEIGPDSFLLSWGLLGLPFACLRVACAFITALVTGLVVERAAPDDVHPEEAESECPDCHSQLSAEQHPLSLRIRAALRYGFFDILDDLAPSLLIGILAGSAVEAYLPASFFQDSGMNPQLQMLAMLIVSAAMYTCAASSTPFAAALLAKGLGAGGLVVFMLFGPASNLPTILVVKKYLGRKAMIAYVATVFCMSLLLGQLVEIFFSGKFQLPGHSHLMGAEHSAAAQAVGAVFLLAIFASVLRRYLPTPGKPAADGSSAACH